jgi:DNA-binding NtrC family response regulator
MQLIQILIIGTNKPIMETIARLIDRDGIWQATIAFSFQDALDMCLQQDFKVVLIGGGIEEEQELVLKQYLVKHKPNLPLVKHYGGGSGLLFAEIHQALSNTNKHQ